MAKFRDFPSKFAQQFTSIELLVSFVINWAILIGSLVVGYSLWSKQSWLSWKNDPLNWGLLIWIVSWSVVALVNAGIAWAPAGALQAVFDPADPGCRYHSPGHLMLYRIKISTSGLGTTAGVCIRITDVETLDPVRPIIKQLIGVSLPPKGLNRPGNVVGQWTSIDCQRDIKPGIGEYFDLIQRSATSRELLEILHGEPALGQLKLDLGSYRIGLSVESQAGHNLDLSVIVTAVKQDPPDLTFSFVADSGFKKPRRRQKGD